MELDEVKPTDDDLLPDDMCVQDLLSVPIPLHNLQWSRTKPNPKEHLMNNYQNG